MIYTIDKEARAAHYRGKARARVEQTALDHARADRSDPFTYNRITSRLFAGTEDLDDYHVDWRKETRKVQTQNGTIDYTIEVATNRKVPTA